MAERFLLARLRLSAPRTGLVGTASSKPLASPLASPHNNESNDQHLLQDRQNLHQRG